MSGAHETLEHAEHAAHDGSHSPSNKIFGVTMACIGVLIAFCSAMVGSERTELTRVMIGQTQAHSLYAGASAKFRAVMIEIENLRVRVATAGDSQGSWSPNERFIQLASDYGNESKLSKEWTESYQPLVNEHFDAAESYEWAQVIAEIGIVVASLAVLLSSRTAWIFAVLLALACIVQLGRTRLHTGPLVAKNEKQIELSKNAYEDLRHAHSADNEDQKAIERLDPDGKIRQAISAHAKALHDAAEAKASGIGNGQDARPQ